MAVSRNHPATSAAMLATRLQRGFTLIEVMVVVVIIGILISLATLSVGSFTDDDVAEHGRRLEALISLALEEAGIQNREIGLIFYQHGYEFSARVPDVDKEGLPIWVWVPLDGDQLLKPRDLSEDIALDLELEGTEATLLYERDTEKAYSPQIFLLSSGDIQPPFKIRIRPAFSGDGIVLDVGPAGDVEISRDEF